MMKIPRSQLSPFFRIHFLYVIIISLSVSNSIGANLNVGEPRTVRMIYFLPNDRPYRDYGVQWIKREILRAQSFYTQQMARHGYEKLSFRIETDSQGEPKVHRVDGEHPNNHYLIDTPSAVEQEISQVFDLRANVYLILIDNSTGRIHQRELPYVDGVGTKISKSGGYALVGPTSNYNLTTHELGHAFGLQHDFRNSSYLMAYGSVCSWCPVYLSVMPIICPCTPISISISHLKTRDRQKLNSFLRA